MSDNTFLAADSLPAGTEPTTASPAGGATLAGAAPTTGRQKLRLVGLVILKRVRFIAVLAAVGCSSATGTR